MTKKDNASDLLAKSIRVLSTENDKPAPSGQGELPKPANLPPEKREPATLAALAAPAPRNGAGRHDAAKALMKAGEIFLQLGETDKGREYLCRAHAELELSLRSYPLDENIKESLAACASALDQGSGFESKPVPKPVVAESATQPVLPSVRAKNLKLADGKNETFELIEQEPKKESVRKPSVPIWSGNLFLLLGLVALSFYGIASGMPHEFLSGDNFLSQLSRRLVAHTMKGSFLAGLSFAALWIVWERINRYRLVLSSKADAYALKGLAIRLVLVISMLGTAVYLADTVYHFLRGA